MKNYANLVDQFLDAYNVGDTVISRYFVMWLRRNHSIPIHPRTAVEHIDRSQRTRKKRLTNSEKWTFWKQTGRWVRLVWIITE
jgi:hypothetical protein